MTMKPEKSLEIAVGLVEHGGKLLLLQRRDAEPMWDKKWEFPGGKIEPGEDASVAVLRELREETALPIEQVIAVFEHRHTWELPERRLHVHLHVFRCASSSDEVCLEAHAAYQAAWVSPEEALAFDLLEANHEILKKVYFAANA